nr:integrase, catalytic region, zinc finger, CCHC-type, peptidase aspartic, catalytic [Tanacetum cinerariifolium]
MTGNLTLLCNFVEKYLGTVRFGNDQFSPILSYGQLVQGNITIKKVYYVKGLNHNLFSVGQFCDTELEVAFQKSTCFVRNLQGNDLLTGNRGSDLYIISLQEMTSSTPICLMAKASPTQAWLWHQRLSHLNFDYINLLSKKDVVIGVPKLKYIKDQLCSSCENGVVEKRNCTLVEAAQTMLLTSKLSLLFWAEAITTACYTQNRSIIIPTHKKTAYHIINDRKPSIKHLHIFRCTCYLTKDGENLDKMKEKRDPCILVGYSTQSKGYRVYNKRTQLIVESIHLRFDEIKEMSETSVANDTSGLVPQRQKALDYDNSGSIPQLQNVSPSADTTVSSQQELDLLFGPLYDKFFITEDTQFHQDEFINPFCTPVREIAESSSRNIDNSNMHTFYQPYDSEYRWTKDHPLEQVRGSPSKPVQTRRQLATDPEMCMFALTVSIAEPKTIKEAMANSVWIEAIQEELHQFDRLHVLELVDRPFNKNIIKIKWLWKNKKDEDQTVIHNKARLVAKGLQIHQSSRGIFINQAKYALEILHKHGLEKGQSIGTPMATKPKLDADLSGNPVDQTDYHSKIGSLMYLTSSRPDIVQEASSFSLIAFLDVDHVGCIETRKSTYGGIQFLGDKLVSWMSKKQDCTAMSSAEAEYVALSASYAQVITEYQLADMFTKALPEDRFKYLVRRIGMRWLTPAELEVLAKESA